MKITVDNHPCFNQHACHKVGRMHLPVAPRCNVMCNFCNRKYDCVNESRPGVTSSVLRPHQALEFVNRTFDKRNDITVIGIAGPGDPFANAEETMETLRLVRSAYPDVLLCTSSNGLGIGPWLDELKALEVTHVTITIPAIDPALAGEIYSWVRHDKKVLRGIEAGKLMIEKQLEAVERIKSLGIMAKVNSIIIPGVNEHHVPEVAKAVAALGADVMNCISMIPVPGAVFEHIAEPDPKTVTRVRFQAGEHLRQMLHCARCRSDAVGLLGKDDPEANRKVIEECAALPLNPTENRPLIAVATQEGMLVNLHLGEATQFHVFAQEADGSFSHKSIRLSPPKGSGPERWRQLGRTLRDCRAVLVNAAGPSPKEELERTGLQVIEMEGLVEEGLACVFAGKPIPKLLQKRFTSCASGVACRGTGTGCD
jgi:nitrogen fixation protein NifB